MKKILRFLLLAAAATALGSFGSVAFDLMISPSPSAAQITPIDEEPDDAPGLGSIIGTPDAGPEPEDAGDRGGYAQLGIAALMLFGVLFIGSRIVLSARQNNTHNDDPL